MKTDSIFKKLFYNNKIKILGVTFCILLISLIFMITKPKKINEPVETSKLETNESKKTSENNSKPTIENKTNKKIEESKTKTTSNVDEKSTSQNINKDKTPNKNTQTTVTTNNTVANNKKATTKSSAKKTIKASKTDKRKEGKQKGSSHTFKSKNLGFSITFPESWHNKYTLVETKDSLSVYFKPKDNSTKNKAFLFTIAEKNANFNEDFYDAINKSLKCNGKTYFVGGSTDIGFPPEHPEFKTYKKMRCEIRIVLDTLKSY